MKKIFAVVLAVVMVLAVAGCGAAAPAPAPESTPAPEAAPAVYKTGLGVITSVAKSASATEEDGAKTQADVTSCAVTIDEQGKIVAVSIDTVQAKVAFDTEGQLKTDLTAAIKTKKELGEDYGMRGASAIGKEWFEQIAALEEYMIGKTVEEVKNMPVEKRDDNHLRVPTQDVVELVSTCTMDVGGYIDALVLAAANAK